MSPDEKQKSESAQQSTTLIIVEMQIHNETAA